MLLANSVVTASVLIAAFNAITAIPHIQERHIIRVPLKFKTIHHHKIKKIPIYIKKHVYYHKEKQPVLEETQSNGIFHVDGHDHFGDHFDYHREEDQQEFRHYGRPNDHDAYDDDDAHDDDYDDEQEQSQEDEYEDDEYKSVRFPV